MRLLVVSPFACAAARGNSVATGHRAMADPEREALLFRDGPEFQAGARRLIADRSLRERLGTAARARVEAELAAHDEIGDYLELLAESAVGERQASTPGPRTLKPGRTPR